MTFFITDIGLLYIFLKSQNVQKYFFSKDKKNQMLQLRKKLKTFIEMQTTSIRKFMCHVNPYQVN